ncbi:uncharacterized protein L969DRAFT_97077 [Mixia osmundae IAM 14324]|uniref:Cdc23 domain-containing protein n=1 Tax=Mixia osmundae (strain CBS 9802 / IAM 14324 / JCM 22182 / KY 12970) TaxID=764103 RepID=G7E1L6_MIXOS|nr:uncharacterized protein L969DRAFT_97077 [Mixia osmundae IAM 14324]KEI36677.1 hypothetical protein L969DRAFT_97077 [Mixia osmundae IAM 14324]GAA96726.1 hypothetical protein E5Q_03397 [Mixia osmundae IAM 14324]
MADADELGRSVALLLRALISRALHVKLDKTALFLAEQLHALRPSDEIATFWLARCLVVDAEPHAALHLLHNTQVHASQSGASTSTWASSSTQHLTPAFSRRAGKQPGHQATEAAYGASVRCATVYAQACRAIGRAKEGQAVLSAAKRQSLLHTSIADPETLVDDRVELDLPMQLDPTDASIHFQLGQLAQEAQEPDEAVKHYRDALESCWYCWDAYEALCRLGRPPHLEAVLGPSVRPPAPSATTQWAEAKRPATRSKDWQSVFSLPHPGAPIDTGNELGLNDSFSNSFDMSYLNMATSAAAATQVKPLLQTRHSHFATAPTVRETTELATLPPLSRSDPASTLPAGPLFTPTAPAPAVSRPPPPLKRPRSNISSETNTPPMMPDFQIDSSLPRPSRAGPDGNRKTLGVGLNLPSSHLMPDIDGSGPQQRKTSLHRVISAGSGEVAPGRLESKQTSRLPSDTRDLKRPKRSDRSDNKSSTSQDTAKQTNGHHSEVDSASSPELIKPETKAKSGPVQLEGASSWLKGIVHGFAQAQSHLAKYECESVISTIFALPCEQRNTFRAWILLALARFESIDYTAADRAFAKARELSPYHVKHMDIYSSLLWHLQKPASLSFIAQEVMSFAPSSAEAWIATGNVFSWGEDHQSALKCFKRALQVSPECILAYTLAGHEALALEEWEHATSFYREAVKKDRVSYRAWYGLGNTYMKTGKFTLAEYHFRRAASINPSNALLVCCIGMALEKLGKRVQALEQYDAACLLAPTSQAVKFRRAKARIATRQFEPALRDLLDLKDEAPDEFNVHYMLGKLYGAMGDRTKMTRHLTYAQDLDPRSAGRCVQSGCTKD